MDHKLTVFLEDVKVGGNRRVLSGWMRHIAFKMALDKVKDLMASGATGGQHEMTHPVGDDGYLTFTVIWSIE